MMTRAGVEAFLSCAGWQQDGDFWIKKLPFKMIGRTGTTEARLVRVKFNKLSVRVDLMRSSATGFFRIGGAPLSAITVREADGAMVVGSYVFEPTGRAARC